MRQGILVSALVLEKLKALLENAWVLIHTEQ